MKFNWKRPGRTAIIAAVLALTVLAVGAMASGHHHGCRRSCEPTGGYGGCAYENCTLDHEHCVYGCTLADHTHCEPDCTLDHDHCVYGCTLDHEHPRAGAGRHHRGCRW